MSKDNNTGKNLLGVGAAMAFCGATLYAVGKTLKFLFRDVDPDQAEKEEKDDNRESAEKEETPKE